MENKKESLASRTIEIDSYKNGVFLQGEEEFVRCHSKDTDEELIQYLIDCGTKLGHTPSKREIIGFTYLKSRFGPWPRVLEKAGLKDRRKKKSRRLY